MKKQLFVTMLKESRRGLLIFSIIMILYGLLIVTIFPSFEKLSERSIKGSDIKLEEIGDNEYHLSWDRVQGYPNHTAVGSKSMGTYLMVAAYIDPDMILNISDLVDNESLPEEYGGGLLYDGEEIFVNFTNSENYQAFWVFYSNDKGNVILSDMVAVENITTTSSFDDYLEDNAFFEGMMGGNMVNMYELRGFLAMEFFSLWPLVMAIYFSIMGLSSITKNVEERSIDVLMATGYTRDRFLVEKTYVILVKFVVISLAAFLGLAIGTLAIGKPVPWTGFVFVFAGGIPFALAFIAIGSLASVFINEYKRGLGIIMGAVFVQYVFQIVSNLSEKVEFLKWFSLFTYWDAGELLIDERFSLINIIIPGTLAIITYMATLYYFRKKEIPV